MIQVNTLKCFMDWFKDKIELYSMALKSPKRIVQRGEVYICKFGFNIGSEQSKTRPCVILQNDSFNTNSPNVIVAPITHTGKGINTIVKISDKYDLNKKLILDGHVLLGNIVTISKVRLGSIITKLDKAEMDKIEEALIISCGLYKKFKSLNNQIKDRDEYILKLKNKIDKLENV